MTGKEAIQKMLFSYSIDCTVEYGSVYHYNPIRKIITIKAIDQSREVWIGSCLHEAAHAIQHKRNKWKIIINAILRNIAPKACILETIEIEKEANALASQWLEENAHLFPRLDIYFIAKHFYPNQLKSYG